jgi:uncharacterized SAM-binding protein YcdF (DUF218 family)
MSSLLKALLMPGSPSLLVILVVAAALLLLAERTREWGRRLVFLVAVGYWLFATPAGAGALAWMVSGPYGRATPEAVAGARAIVVLDGGTSWYRIGDLSVDVPIDTTVLRALEGARIARLLPDAVVIATGGSASPRSAARPEAGALVDALARAGVARERIVLDSTSANTRAHAVQVGQMLRDRGAERFVLVTSATHLRRSVAAFEREGLRPVPAPAPMWSDDAPDGGIRRWLPDRAALWVSEQAVYDAIGFTYYWIRGWV